MRRGSSKWSGMAMCVLHKNSNGQFFHAYHTAHILPPHIPTSWEPSKMPSVGKALGAMTRLLKKWRSDWEYKIQTGTRWGRCSCFSLAQGCLSWWTLFSKLRCLIHLSSSPMFEELYNKLLTITNCAEIRFGQPPYIVHVELILTYLKPTLGHVGPAPHFTSRVVV